MPTSTKYHFGLNVPDVLANWCARDVAGLLINPDTGRPLNAKECKAVLMDELIKGHAVLPIGHACEGFDYTNKGCPGHTEIV